MYDSLVKLDERQPIHRTVHHKLDRFQCVVMEYVQGTSMNSLGTERAAQLLDAQTQTQTREEAAKSEGEEKEEKKSERDEDDKDREEKKQDGGEKKTVVSRRDAWAARLRTIGQICGLDILIRNTDRIPLVVVSEYPVLC